MLQAPYNVPQYGDGGRLIQDTIRGASEDTRQRAALLQPGARRGGVREWSKAEKGLGLGLTCGVGSYNQAAATHVYGCVPVSGPARLDGASVCVCVRARVVSDTRW